MPDFPQRTAQCRNAASLKVRAMDNIIARYEDYLIHTKHASANTVSSYAGHPAVRVISVRH